MKSSSYPPPTKAFAGKLRRGSSFWLLSLLVLAACGSTPERFYTLSSAPSPVTASSSSPSVFVGPVSVPEAVDRSPMVMRSGPNQVDIEEFHRWAEPLKTAIPRVIAENLMRELRTTRVLASRQASSGAFDYRVAVDVTRFESSLDAGAALEATWTITPGKGSPARTGRTVARESAASRSHEGVAAAHSRALETLAREIAAAIK